VSNHLAVYTKIARIDDVRLELSIAGHD
jgi:hypothetical protein